MPLCVMKYCKNNSNSPNTDADLSYHRFPKDEQMKDKWIEIIRIIRNEPEWYPSPYSVICSKHFVKSDRYGSKNGYNRLHKHAVPCNNLAHTDDNNKVEVPKKAPEVNVGIIVGFKIDNTSAHQSIHPIVIPKPVCQTSMSLTPERSEIELMEMKVKNQTKKFLDLKLSMKGKLKILEERVKKLTKTNIALRAKLKS